jgi:very-short-patch-repair endonuclease
MSDMVQFLLTRIRQTGLPEPVTEYAFAPPRKWRFDLAWPDRHIAIEVDGGTWTGGRHVSGTGYERDCIKLNMAAELGWTVYRYTSGMVLSDEAIMQLERVVGREAI